MDEQAWVIAALAGAVALDVMFVLVPMLRNRKRGSAAPPGGKKNGESSVGVGEPLPVVVGDIPREPLAFQPRADLLASLEAALESRVVVLSSVAGMRGVGKTHLAAAYARAQIAAQWRLVAWINAEDAGGVLAGLAGVAPLLGLSAYEGDAMAASRAVRHWLEADGKRCLLVFDNATDPKLLEPFIPTTGMARVVITSNQESVANLGAEMPVDVFAGQEALAFFAKRTGLDDAKGAGALAAELGHLPLALAQAAAVIAAQNLSYGIYLDRLRAMSMDRKLNAGEYPRQVTAMVLMSLDGARTSDDAAACTAVMEFLAVLSPAGVRKSLMYDAAQQGALEQGGHAGALSPEAVDRALARLAEASLLTFSVNGTSVSVHRLVMGVIRGQLAAKDTLADVCAAAAQLLDGLAGTFTHTWPKNRPAVRDLVAQVMALYESSATWRTDSSLVRQMIRLRVLAVWFLGVLGDTAAQSILIQEPVQVGQERALGAGHPDKVGPHENRSDAHHYPFWIRRSHVIRPHLSLARTYVTEFTVKALLDLIPVQINSMRLGVIKRAANQLHAPNVTIECDLTLYGNLTITVSVADYLPTTDRITDRTLEEVKRYADEAFRSFPQKLEASIEEFLTADRAGKQSLGSYGQSYSRFMRTDFFGMAPFRVATSTVDFSVEPRVTAVIRNQSRLEFLAEGSIIDYYETYRARPRPNQYTISQSGKSSLRVTADEERVAEDVSAALLGESRGSRAARRAIDRWPPATTPYWGVGTLALAIFAVAIAAFNVTPVWLAVTALGITLAVGSTLMMAKRAGAGVPKTALGMSPSAIVLGFAVYYGSLMGGNHPSVIVTATNAPHLVDAFLLSLGMASTGGFFDLALHTTAVRVAAFAEMLLMVTVAGGSLYAGARAAWDRLTEVVVRTGVPG